MRLAPLYLALAAADRLAGVMPARAAPRQPPWRKGVSVVIPERDAPAMLAEALATLRHALAGVDEPHQVIVVANGTPAAAYDGLKAQFPEVEFEHADVPLGFVGAIERGVARARYDWTYLMNNDMTLDADTLTALLPARGDDVFAVASQIYQQSADGRREETGFTDWYIDHSGLQLWHAPVRDDAVTPHLCASGGAALFRTAVLRRYLPPPAVTTRSTGKTSNGACARGATGCACCLRRVPACRTGTGRRRHDSLPSLSSAGSSSATGGCSMRAMR